jgi:hypothetical protein
MGMQTDFFHERGFMNKLLMLPMFALLTSHLQASEQQLPDHGVRINVLWPLYPGKKYRLAYRLALLDHSQFRTELIMGFGISLPEKRDTEGRFSEANGSVAIRQYFGSAWHLELMTAYGQSRLEDHVSTGRDYTSRDLELMGLIGYEWKFAEAWSLDTQAGAGKIIQKSNPWPIYEDKTLQKEIGEVLIPIGVLHLTYWL